MYGSVDPDTRLIYWYFANTSPFATFKKKKLFWKFLLPKKRFTFISNFQFHSNPSPMRPAELCGNLFFPPPELNL